MFLMMWKNCKEADLVPASQVSLRCPEVAISYYENRTKWYTKDTVIELDWLKNKHIYFYEFSLSLNLHLVHV